MDIFCKDVWINPSLINHKSNQQRFLNLSTGEQLQHKQHLYHSLGEVRNPKEGWTGYEDVQEKVRIIKRLRR
jgi:hypothetical protein